MVSNGPDGEFTRLKSSVQLGDGPDQRGDVTVEVVREKRPREGFERRDVEVELPDGSVVEGDVDDATFAEFYTELDRATRVLSDALGLADDGAEGDG
jgi:hypothetical protein